MVWLCRIFVLLVGAGLLAAQSATEHTGKAEIPEYIGSRACLPCHSEVYSRWAPSNHATMVVPIINSANLPLDIAAAPPNLQPELRKATFMVANSFFISRDAETGRFKMLGVIYDKAAKAYAPSNLRLDWSTACAGCHTTNMNTPDLTFTESGIGCEACHGPGRDHALSKGDPTKIVSRKEADVCGQCHGGNDVQTGAKLMSDGTKWVVGFRPGMKLSDVKGLQLTPVDPEKTPPDPGLTANHLRNYNMWAASAHNNALSRVAGNARATAECYGCHSAEGFAARLQNKKVDLADAASFSTISCVACHDPHNSEYSGQLVMAPEALCESCHSQGGVLKGNGAREVEQTASFHSGLSCVQCHMTEANHLMKVIRPDAPDLAEKRADTCTSCHTSSTKQDRAARLQEWQATFTNRMSTLESDTKTISAALKDHPELLSPELKLKLNTVRANLSLLTRDKSRGAHNFEYSVKVMDQAARDLAPIKSALESH